LLLGTAAVGWLHIRVLREAIQQADAKWEAAHHAEEQARQAQAAAMAREAAAAARSAALDVEARVTLADAEKRRRNAAGAAERRRRQLAQQRGQGQPR
jgi:hypothetical protein